jgi:DNA ligase 1
MKTNELLKEVDKFITEINQSNSTNYKEEVLRKYNHLEKIFFYTFNPYKKFYITSANIKKVTDQKYLIEDWHDEEELFDFLDKLSTREISGHEALHQANRIANTSGYPETFFKIIDKNLETRANATLINKVFPGMIPEFKVQLAKNRDDLPKSKSIDPETEMILSSTKMDGLRCLAFIKDGDVKFFSRTGNEFLTLDNLRKEILKFFPKESLILDGEVCIIDENGNEDFQSILKEYNKKNHTIENPKFLPFDILSYEEFFARKGKIPFKEKYKLLLNLFENVNSDYLEPLKQTIVENENHLKELSENAFRLGREGLILRRGDAVYEGKRGNNIIKIKNHFDGEFVVKKIINGPIRFIEDGMEKTQDMLASVKIEFKGNEVGVGSGFSIEQRKYYYEHPEELIGKTITVRWMEETMDEEGNPSLRHTRIKAIHGDKREV